MSSTGGRPFVFQCTSSASDLLLREGTDTVFGARHLKRAIERHLVFPFANLIATEQVQLGDVVTVDYCPTSSKLIFSKEDQGALAESLDEVEAEMPLVPASDGYASASTMLAGRAPHQMLTVQRLCRTFGKVEAHSSKGTTSVSLAISRLRT